MPPQAYFFLSIAFSLIAWGIVAGLFAGGGVALIQVGAAEPLRTSLIVGWIVILTPLVVVLGLAGAGWSGHRVYILELENQARRTNKHQGALIAPTTAGSADLRLDVESTSAVGER